MTRRNWFAALVAPLIAKLSNVGQWKRAENCKYFSLAAKLRELNASQPLILRNLPEGFRAFDKTGRRIYPGDVYTSLRLESTER